MTLNKKRVFLVQFFLTRWKAEMEVMRWRDEVGDVRGGYSAKTKLKQASVVRIQFLEDSFFLTFFLTPKHQLLPRNFII